MTNMDWGVTNNYIGPSLNQQRSKYNWSQIYNKIIGHYWLLSVINRKKVVMYSGMISNWGKKNRAHFATTNGLMLCVFRESGKM